MASLYYVIPAQVFEDDRLGFSEKMFYALLSGLSFSCGYCYATDKYLADRMKLKLRQIQYMLELLEQLGYVKRETHKVGMKWERKIFITHSRLDSNKVCESHYSAPSKRTTVRYRDASHCDIVSEDIISESSSSTPPKERVSSDPPPTAEEEEELEKRFRERPKGYEKVISKKLWRKTVLSDIRKQKEDIEERTSVADKHKQQAFNMDGRTIKGCFVSATQKQVEFTHGSFYKAVPYDISDAEWVEMTKRWFEHND